MTPFDEEPTEVTKFVIHTGPFRADAHTGLRGVVYFETPAGAFPAVQWRDAAAVLFSGWIDGFIQLAHGATRYAEFSFMEGPYSVRVEIVAPSRFWLRFQDSGRALSEASEVYSLEVPFFTLGQALLLAAESILAVVRSEGWHHPDLNLLGERVQALSREMEATRSD